MHSKHNKTICNILQERAQNKPDAIAYRFLLDGEAHEISMTYSELDLKAQSIAFHLKQYPKNRSALLLFPAGLEFIAAFFGCLYAGVIAIPASVPRNSRSTERLKNIVKDANTTLILTDTSTYHSLSRASAFSILNIDQVLITETCKSVLIDTYEENSIAFIQYTSGSTQAPKGVIISHRNIMANQEMIKEAFQHNETTIFAGWLPLFHDMGLIGNVLQPLYLGIPSILMSPFSFIQKPVRWLNAISHYQATTSGGPNFAYDLCVEKIGEEEKQGLDLSCWTIAFNGSEPIHAATLKRFTEAFSAYGFKYHAFYPCYGLAETTLFVTGHTPKTDPYILEIDKNSIENQQIAVFDIFSKEKTYHVVSSGSHSSNQKVMIVDPDKKTPCSFYHQGEVWIKGEHVASGYWNNPDGTKSTFGAILEGFEGTFLKTGDLGFLDAENRLYITGRLKDLIIIRGKNIHPQDLEITVEETDPALCSHGCAAFCIQEETERLVIVAEIKRESLRYVVKDDILMKIRIAINAHHAVNPSAILLIKPNTLPKTSSGKIQRQLCKQLFLSNKLETIF